MQTQDIDICLSPETIHLFDLKGKIVVVTDIFRATSTMVTALAHGIERVIPVTNLEEVADLEGEHYIKAAERGGKKVDGFEYGNSPFDYMGKETDGKTLIMTTTNGTKALNLSQEADEVLIGAFLNLEATVEYLKSKNKSIIIFCAGWKGKFSLEDTLYAGALAEHFYTENTNSDSAFSAIHLYKTAQKEGLLEFIKNANHYRRLTGFNNQKDVEFCMQLNQYDLVGKMEGNQINSVSLGIV